MRRSKLTLVAVLAVAVAATVTLTPATAIGPGGWDHVGHGATTTSASLNGKVSALNTQRAGYLYVGGTFDNAGGHASADRIAKWNGTSWSAVGSPSLTDSDPYAAVRAIAYDAATGKVYAGGTFQNAGGNANADFLAVWDGVSWKPVCNSPSRPAFTGNVDALQIIGTTIYVGGEFQDGAELPTADYLLACDLSSGASSSLFITDGQFSGSVYALTAIGTTLYVGGNFGNLAKIPAADYVAAYESGTWHALGAGAGPSGGAVTGIVRSLTASGTKVYVGTDALDVAGIAKADHVARWDESTLAWTAVGANHAQTNGWFPASAYIYALRTYGSLIFAAGSFQNADGASKADNIAYFDGTHWRVIGSNGAGDGPLPAEVHALRVFKYKLYAGGNFTSAGGDTRARALATFALRQPDAWIGEYSGYPYLGNNVYNATGVGQTRKLSMLKGGFDGVQVDIQNDGLVAASFKIKATGGANGISAVFRRYDTQAVITSAVRAGTFSTGVIPPNGRFIIKVRINVNLASAPGTTFMVTARSVAGTQPDAVRVIVTTHR